jgi:hypothetical protein
MRIVYNIQLKTTTEKNKTIFSERVSAIRNFINQVFINDTPREKAKKLFQFFKTEVSNRSDLNQMLQRDIDAIVTSQLKGILTK